MVMAALSNDLKPAMEAHRRLIARWSCSTMLLRYLQVDFPALIFTTAHLAKALALEMLRSVQRATNERSMT